jgi:hypothetical protein
MGTACGIDESTANYIAMRAFGEPDAFPSREPALRRSLVALKTIVSPAKAIELADQWRPMATMASVCSDASCTMNLEGECCLMTTAQAAFPSANERPVQDLLFLQDHLSGCPFWVSRERSAWP